MEATGKVIKNDTLSGVSSTGKEWKKKVVVIEFLEGMNTKHLAFELFGEDKIANNPVRKGQEVTVYYDINSTEWNGRWFTQLSAYRISEVNSKTGKAEFVQPETAQFKEEEELPF